MNAKAESLGAELASQLAFLDPEILAIPSDKLTAWRDTESLKPFGHFIDAITVNRAHVLTTAAEALIASAGDALNASHATFNVLNNSDLQFGFVENEDGETVQLSNGLYGQLIRSTNRKLRKEAFEALLRAYESLKNTFAQTLSGQVKAHNFNATAHHYKMRVLPLWQVITFRKVCTRRLSTRLTPTCHFYIVMSPCVKGVGSRSVTHV